MSFRADVLVLNADGTPLKLINWQQAVLMLLDRKVDLVAGYPDKNVRSISVSMPWPAVVRLQGFVKTPVKIRFSRQNVLARDSHTCGYCGARPRTQAGKPKLSALTIDHVVPRAHSSDGKVTTASGKRVQLTCWENVVTACIPCNSTKADRTPRQARMPLLIPPRYPNRSDVLRMMLARVRVPGEWWDYLPSDLWTSVNIQDTALEEAG